MGCLLLLSSTLIGAKSAVSWPPMSTESRSNTSDDINMIFAHCSYHFSDN